jgi:hypothetical protein
LPFVEGTLANPDRAAATGGGAVIRLDFGAATSSPPAFLGQRGRRLWEALDRRQRPGRAGGLLIGHGGVAIDAPAAIAHRLRVPWSAIRKVVVDDGSRWGHVAASCRFPVYDIRSDRGGSGALIGPLWSHAAAIMPSGCAVELLDPVPQQPPNVAFVFEPAVALAANVDRPAPTAIVSLMLCVENTDAARAAFRSSVAIGDVDHDDLEYLTRVGSRGTAPASAPPPSPQPPLRRTPGDLDGHRTRSSAHTSF